MKDISNFGNNLRDEIIEYRLEHETGYTLEIKFVDIDNKTNAQIYLYSKTGEFLSKTDPFPFDPAGQRVIDDVKLIKGSDEDHDAEYEIKVTFRGSRDPIYCPVDDILTTLRKELSNKITTEKMTAQNISMIADAESEEAKPTSVFVADVKDKKVTVYDLDVDNSIKIGNTVLNEATLTKLMALVESMTETKEK